MIQKNIQMEKMQSKVWRKSRDFTPSPDVPLSHTYTCGVSEPCPSGFYMEASLIGMID